MSNLIAKRYAKALFELAKEQNILEAVSKDVMDIHLNLRASKEFVHWIESPIIPESRQQETLKSLFGNKIHKVTLNFLLLLTAKKRINLLSSVILEFEDLYLKDQGILKVTITTREPIAQELKQPFLSHLNKKFNKRIDPVWTIDPSILGGFKIQAADYVEDYSLQTQLDQFERELIYK